MTTLYTILKDKLKNNHDIIEKWFVQKESELELPLYTSVDIRDAGFKLSIVDTNLFPAGFNNICEYSLKKSEPFFNLELKKRVKNCNSILFFIEEHTRNIWYLENVFSIKKMIENIGIKVKVVTIFDAFPESDKEKELITIKTALDNELAIYNLRKLLESESSPYPWDLILLNNDLSKSLPIDINNLNIPIFPRMHMGWHKRLKSTHFKFANTLIDEFCSLIDLDPWLISCYFSEINDVSINDDNDRKKIHQHVSELFKNIQTKYDQYGIKEKPFIFLKANSGTYGMGIMVINDPEDVLTLNRKSRNKLSTGKQSQDISSFIIQEGVPSIAQIDQKIAEACIYSIANHFVGGFYRVNDIKGTRENLNAKGMRFIKMCTAPNSECVLKNQEEPAFKSCGIDPDNNLDIYRILSQLSGIAAAMEASACLEDKNMIKSK